VLQSESALDIQSFYSKQLAFFLRISLRETVQVFSARRRIIGLVSVNSTALSRSLRRNIDCMCDRSNRQYPFCWGASSNERASPMKRKLVIDWSGEKTISIKRRAKSGIDARGGARG
jgi:hypothetical protein